MFRQKPLVSTTKTNEKYYTNTCQDLVDKYILAVGFEKNVNYFIEMYLKDIDLSVLFVQGKVAKRFDFIIKTNNMVLIQTSMVEIQRLMKWQEATRCFRRKLVLLMDSHLSVLWTE